MALIAAAFIAPMLSRVPLGLRTLLNAGVISVAMRLAIGPLRSRLRSRRSL